MIVLTGINEKSAVQQEGVSAVGALIDMLIVMWFPADNYPSIRDRCIHGLWLACIYIRLSVIMTGLSHQLPLENYPSILQSQYSDRNSGNTHIDRFRVFDLSLYFARLRNIVNPHYDFLAAGVRRSTCLKLYLGYTKDTI